MFGLVDWLVFQNDRHSSLFSAKVQKFLSTLSKKKIDQILRIKDTLKIQTILVVNRVLFWKNSIESFLHYGSLIICFRKFW